MLDEYYVTLARSSVNKAIENLMQAQSYLSQAPSKEQDVSRMLHRIQLTIVRCRYIQDVLEFNMEDGKVKRM
jgi:hypothetical protein